MIDVDPSALLWDAVLGDLSWNDIPRALAASTGAPFACLLQVHPGFSVESWQHNLVFGGDGVFPSTILDLERNGVAKAMRDRPPGSSLDRRQLVSDLELERDASMAPLIEQGVYHGLIGKLAGRGLTEAGYWIAFPQQGGDGCAPARHRFQSWMQPLQRALRVRSMLDDARETTLSCMDALGGRDIGAVLVDRELRIRGTNAEAERILAARDGIHCRRGALILGSEGAQQTLRQRIRSLWLPPDAGQSGPTRVRRPSGLPDYSVEILPARRGGVATVLLSDPMVHALPDVQKLMLRFGLTAAEARVARLSPLAVSKAQIADQVGLSENTVKTHLAAARAKIGARNMVELALRVQKG